jgi:hypothetical protein
VVGSPHLLTVPVEVQAQSLPDSTGLQCAQMARRIAIRQPLGYGLDARVAENLGRYRFKPGMKDGKPVAVEMVVNQTFDVYPGAR